MRTLIPRLEQAATNSIKSSMARFTGSASLTCPWMRWLLLNPPSTPIEGLLLMQDWGNQAQALGSPTQPQSAIWEIDQAVNGSHIQDRTLDNLTSVQRLGNAIKNRRLCVSNAVWGLRLSGQPKSGYLGAAIHKASFPIWLELVINLSHRSRDPFKLVLAGGWSAQNGIAKRSPLCLSHYLQVWMNWAAKNRGSVSVPPNLIHGALNCKGVAYHVSHPAVWNSKCGTANFVGNLF
jgi:hypothetical protein